MLGIMRMKLTTKRSSAQNIERVRFQDYLSLWIIASLKRQMERGTRFQSTSLFWVLKHSMDNPCIRRVDTIHSILALHPLLVVYQALLILMEIKVSFCIEVTRLMLWLEIAAFLKSASSSYMEIFQTLNN